MRSRRYGADAREAGRLPLKAIAAVRYTAKFAVAKIMNAQDHLRRIAIWSRDLSESEIEVARSGIVEKSYRANKCIFMRGDRFDYWIGIVSGLARMGVVSRGGKATSFTGLTADAWFGEGTVLKNEARRYDVVSLRDTRIALMDRKTGYGE